MPPKINMLLAVSTTIGSARTKNRKHRQHSSHAVSVVPKTAPRLLARAWRLHSCTHGTKPSRNNPTTMSFARRRCPSRPARAPATGSASGRTARRRMPGRLAPPSPRCPFESPTSSCSPPRSLLYRRSPVVLLPSPSVFGGHAQREEEARRLYHRAPGEHDVPIRRYSTAPNAPEPRALVSLRLSANSSPLMRRA